MGEFTHFNEQGHAVMVDVSEKSDTVREATAMGRISMSQECFEKVKTGGMKKGDVLGTARIAGIMGAKRTSELIPLCHILNLSKVTIEFEYIEAACEIEARCTAKTVGKTGVEMEALTGVQVALLTIYDMCKAVDKGMCMKDIRLLEKTGGKSGVWKAEKEKGHMIDAAGRTIDYMRISITDRCNLRCRYCMPDGITQVAMSEILTYEEIKKICTLAEELGIRKIKITGGEPLVRKGCVDLIGMIKEIPGIIQVTMTTNGVLLKENLKALKDAGLDGINISLDTLDHEKYRKITGTDACKTVLEAVEASAESGIRTKVNSVLQDAGDRQEWRALVRLAEKLPVDVRFIELMPIGCGKKNTGVSNLELLNEIKKEYPDIRTDPEVHGNGPAVYYRIPGFKGSIGFISAMHGKFCNTCNRIRLTSTGDLKPCLCYGDTYPLKKLLKSGTDDEIREQIKHAIENKPAAHCFEKPGEITEAHQMAQIGG